MKLIMGQQYKVGKTECVLVEVDAEFAEYHSDAETVKTVAGYNCHLMNDDGFDRWARPAEMTEV